MYNVFFTYQNGDIYSHGLLRMLNMCQDTYVTTLATIGNFNNMHKPYMATIFQRKQWVLF